MRVLGVDPGLTRCGLGVVDVDASRRASLVYVGVARTDKDLATHFRLRTIAAARPSSSPPTTRMMPLMPATPKPGITKISTTSRQRPTTKASISALWASPSM